MHLKRRRLLALLGGALAGQACGGVQSTPEPEPDLTPDEIAEGIVSGGQGVDTIPPIDRPIYVERSDGDRLWSDDTVVDGIVDRDGFAVAYPRPITVWHEIVNEEIDDERVAITYCPLTGSTVVFSGRLADGVSTTFGTTEGLFNSNLVMYDRATSSFWPQLLGTAVTGSRKGERLIEVPIAVTTTYGRWKRRYPRTAVLSSATGVARPYGTSPYGDYDSNDLIAFPVRGRDRRFHPKKVFIGVRQGTGALAIAKQEFIPRGVANLNVGAVPLVALADVEFGAVRVFKRETGRGLLSFAARAGALVDEQTGSRWSPLGHSIAGELAGGGLAPVSAFDVQWFAWYAFYPRTQVLE